MPHDEACADDPMLLAGCALPDEPGGLERMAEAVADEYARFGHGRAEMLAMFRALRLVGSPYVLPPGTSRDRVEILRAAMRKSFQDPDFPKDYRKLAGDDPSPLMGEEQEKAIRELPRDAEVVDLFKKLTDAGPLPPR